MEETFLVKRICICRITMVVALGNSRTFQQDLIVFTYLNLNIRDRTTYGTNGEFLIQMNTGNRSKTFGQAITYHHSDTNRKDEFLNFRTHVSTSSRENIRILQAQLLAHHAQDSLIDYLIFKFKCQRRTLTIGKIFHITLAANSQSVIKQFLLERRSLIHLSLHSNIHFLPESRHTTHTSRMNLSHAFLYLMRVSVDKKSCAFTQAEVRPCTFKDMCERQKVDDTILVCNRDTLIIRLNSSIILSVCKHHSLAITSSTTGIEDICQIIHISLLIKFLHFSLARKILTQLDEILEI